jgi:hypothetical protein
MKKIHDVDEENVYRTCIGGSTRVPDLHRRGKIPYGADPRVVHDREPNVDRLNIGNEWMFPWGLCLKVQYDHCTSNKPIFGKL